MCEIMERIAKEERQLGWEAGKAEGKIEILYDLVNEGQLSMEAAAKKADMTADRFAKQLEEYNLRNNL